MRTICLFLCTASLTLAYIQNTDGNGNLLHRTDNTNIQMLLNNKAVAGLTNASSPPQTWIAAGGNVTLAVNAALSTWNSIPTANVHFASVESTALLDGTPCTGQAGVTCSNVIAFDDTPENREAIGGAIAITVNTFQLNNSGIILKSDIIFSPTLEFSTNLAPGTYDIQSIVTHELGHVLGSSHSGVLSATMFWATQQQNSDYSRPQADDLAFVTSCYSPASQNCVYSPNGGSYGMVSGSIVDSNGNALHGALISIEDPTSGQIIGGFSSLTVGAPATFSILAPPGNYHIWAEPLGGQIQPGNLYNGTTVLTATQVDEAFQPLTPATALNVTSGVVSSAQLTAPAGASPVQISQTGVAPTGAENFNIGPGSIDVPSGQTQNLFIDAKGMGPDFSAANVSFIGPVTVVSAKDAGFALPDGELYEITINVAPVSVRTSGSLFINYKGNTASFSGGMAILPTAPVFPSDGVANVFSYQASAVAPGEIVAIFGTNMGPPAGASGGFDLDGNLATYVDGVQVTFDGQPAPIYYAGAGQINVEVPFEVAGQSSTSIIVNTGTASAAVSIPVESTLIGLFPAAANFPSYALNSASNPTAGGDYVILYAVGLGALQTPVATGAEVSGSPDAAAAPVTVSFGGQTVTAYFAGAAPGFTGLGQITVQVPSGLASGPVQVTASSAGQTSKPILVYVQ
jgi:uncharacterized protein (TIGR03437 family)